MGYRIIYGEDPFEPEKKRCSHLKSMTAAFALAFVVLVRLFWPQGTVMLRKVLLPGEYGALEQLTEDLRSGEPVGEAVTAFCRTIVEDAVAQAD